jgi:catechol 2,3-dioxygenase-like lactoylglutathione lyase family enzyme
MGRFDVHQPEEGTMLSNAPVAVVLPSTDLERSKDFYGTKLGLKLRPGDGPLVFEAGGDTLVQVYFRPEGVKPEHTVAAFRVTGIGDVIQGLVDNGVVFEDYDGMDNHIMASGQSRLAWFKDPDGNTIALDEYLA